MTTKELIAHLKLLDPEQSLEIKVCYEHWTGTIEGAMSISEITKEISIGHHPNHILFDFGTTEDEDNA